MGAMLLKTKDVMSALSLTKSSLFRLLKESDFPQPTKIGRINYWSTSEVSKWAEDQLSKR